MTISKKKTETLGEVVLVHLHCGLPAITLMRKLICLIQLLFSIFFL